MDVMRRTLLGAMLAAPVLATAVPGAAQAAVGQRATIILSPHQDDEVVRLSTYAIRATARGDLMHLVQATDGSATYVGRKFGLTPQETAQWRYREQANAWAWLTSDKGKIHRLGLPDGGARSGDVYAGIRKVIDAVPAGVTPEVYVATYPKGRTHTTSADLHADHLACVDAAYRLVDDGVIVRFARHITRVRFRGGVRYSPSGNEMRQVRAAVDAYRPIGWVSTVNLAEVIDVGGVNVVDWP